MKILALAAIAIITALFLMPHITSLLKVNAQLSEAESDPVLTFRGRNFEKYDIGNFQEKIVIGVEPWTWDSSQSRFVDHVVKNHSQGNLDVQSGLISVNITPDYSVLTDSNMTESKATERWVVYADSEVLIQTYTGQTILDGADRVEVVNSYDLTFSDDKPAGRMELKFILPDGSGLQRIVSILELDTGGIDASQIRIERIWQALTAKVDAYRAEDFEDVVSKEEIVDLEKTTYNFTSEKPETVSFYSLDGELQLSEDLESSKSHLEQISFSQTEIKFRYSAFPSGTSLQLIDDTLTATAATDGEVRTATGSGASCPSPSTKNTSASTMSVKVPDSSDTTLVCERAFAEFDISSIPASTDVTNVVFKFDVSTATNGRNCLFTPMLTTRPSIGSAADVWTEIGDGTPYLNSDVCTSAADNKEADLGTQADADLESMLASGWFAVGLMASSESRDGSDHITEIDTNEAVAATPDPTLEVTYTALVTVPITLNMRSGSDTPETAGVAVSVSCTGGGGNHDGNAATQNFNCHSGTTVTVTMPADTSDSRFRFNDGLTVKSFSACASGTCSGTTYSDVTRQLKITITVTGVDANRNLSVERTQLGSLGTDLVPGSAATGVWADQGSTMTASDEVVITASQERFKSYNSTAQRTITVSSAASKTYVFQHEFNELFRLQETNAGDNLSLNPAGTYTSTITSANGTAIAMTFNTRSTDGYSETPSRTWVKNGTQTFGAVSWQSITVKAAGATCSVTSYGNCDTSLTGSQHLGFDSTEYFRYGVDGATSLSSATYSTDVFSFSATAGSGTRLIKVEYLNSEFDSVLSVAVDGTTLSASDWSVAGGDPTSILTVNNVAFSTKSITVTFNHATGAGGGGGGGSSPKPGSSGTFTLKVSGPTYNVAPGESQVQNLTISWKGTTKIVITNIRFAENAEWFSLDRPLPFPLTVEPGELNSEFTRQIPLTVTVPRAEQGLLKRIGVVVEATDGYSQSQYATSIAINFVPTTNLGYIVLGVLATFGGIAVVLRARKKR